MKFHIRNILIFSLLFFGIATGLLGEKSPEVQNGILDLRGVDVKGQIISMNGQWEFHWKCFLDPENVDPDQPPDRRECGESSGPPYYPVPGLWNSDPELSGTGFASYRLLVYTDQAVTAGMRIPEAYSAYRMYLNGIPISGNGHPSEDPDEEIPYWLIKTPMVSLDRGANEFVIHVSSASHRKGGTWSSIEIGDPERIISQREIHLGIELILLGSLVMMGIYHTGLYILRKDERASLLFGLFSLGVAVRVSVTGERMLNQIFPLLPYDLSLRLEYITMFLTAPLFLSYFYTAFHMIRLKWIPELFWGFSSLFLIITFVTPPIVFTNLAVPYQVFILVMVVGIIYSLYRGVKRKIRGIWIAFVGFVPLSFATFGSILFNNDYSIPWYLLPEFSFPLGVLWFIFAQSYLLASRMTEAYQGVEDLTMDLAQTSRSYSRFVPVEFMRLLQKQNIKDVKPGDQVRMDITILFLDIRNFTGLSESISPEENFAFINAFLERMSPAIHENGGFIDKFMGDGIMALFPGKPDDAMEAAMAMQIILNRYNLERQSKNWKPIHVGIGIHTGSMILGMVGTDRRMDGSVISDAVNVGARVENLTRHFNSSVLFTLDSLIAMKNPGRYRSRIIGRVHVKGKNDTVPVVELLDAIDNPTKFLDTVQEFEEALELFHLGEMEKAYQLFKLVIDVNQDDRAARMYLHICERAIENPEAPVDLELRPGES